MDAITAAIAALPSEQQSEWAELQHNTRDPLDSLSQWTPEARRAVEVALHDYALASDDARDVLREITRWSHRIGRWLACRVARESLRYVPEVENRPRRAIETTERWLRGEASAEEREDTYHSARIYSHDIQVATNYVPSETTNAAIAAASAVGYSDRASYAAADAAARARAVQCAAWHPALRAELRRLCSVIANEIATALDVLGEPAARDRAKGRKL